MSIARTVFLKVQGLPEQQAQEVLDFVDFIHQRYVNQQPIQTQTNNIKQYVGMVKIKATGQKRSLDQFDPATMVTQL